MFSVFSLFLLFCFVLFVFSGGVVFFVFIFIYLFFFFFCFFVISLNHLQGNFMRCYVLFKNYF